MKTLESNYGQLQTYKNSQRGVFTVGFSLSANNEKLLRSALLGAYLCRAMGVERERLQLVQQYNVVDAEEERVAEFVFELADDLKKEKIQRAFA